MFSKRQQAGTSLSQEMQLPADAHKGNCTEVLPVDLEHRTSRSDSQGSSLHSLASTVDPDECGRGGSLGSTRDPELLDSCPLLDDAVAKPEGPAIDLTDETNTAHWNWNGAVQANGSAKRVDLSEPEQDELDLDSPVFGQQKCLLWRLRSRLQST